MLGQAEPPSTEVLPHPRQQLDVHRCTSVVNALIAALTTQQLPNIKINTSNLKALSLRYENSSMYCSNTLDHVPYSLLQLSSLLIV